MKLKVKLSNTQKFVLNLDKDTFGDFKNEIKKFVLNTYNTKLSDPVTLSLNGKDGLYCDDDIPLEALGIVPGDLIIVLQNQPRVPLPSATSSANIPQQKTDEQCSIAQEETSSHGTTEGYYKIATKQHDSKSGNSSNECSFRSDSNTFGSTFGKNIKQDNVECDLVDNKSILSTMVLTKYKPMSGSDAITLVAHATMIECGFKLQLENSKEDLPTNWNSMTVVFTYTHAGFNNFVCNISHVTMGDTKLIAASFTQQESEILVKIKIKEYLLSDKFPLLQDDVRVTQLARLLRDQLLYPLQVEAHQRLGVPAPWHMAGLPSELLMKICSLLDANSLVNLGATCHRLHQTVNDNNIWHKMFQKEFTPLYNSNYKNSGNQVDWKAKYREAQRNRKEWEKRENTEYVLPDPESNYQYPFRHPRQDPFFPGFIQPNPPYFIPQTDPRPNPFRDPDSPFFEGEYPQPRNPLGPLGPVNPNNPLGPIHPDPLGPIGPMGPQFPRRPQQPSMPPFMMPGRNNNRGPNFDFF